VSGEGWHVLRWHRLAVEESLPVVAAQGPQQAVLLARLDAFGRDPQLEALAQSDDGPEEVDVGSWSLRVELGDEAAVDLEPVEG